MSDNSPISAQGPVSQAPTPHEPIPQDPVVDRAAAALDPSDDGRWKDAVREIFSASPWVALGSLVLAFLVGSIMIAFTDSAVQEAAGWFFSRPGDTFAALGSAIGNAYSQLFQGAIFNFAFFERGGFLEGIRPLMSTLGTATPLIAAGLGVAVSFRAGLFNIGGRGQMIFAAMVSGWLGFTLTGIPFPLLLIICLLAGMLAGSLWAGLAGYLKAKTGAHEVIATIMLNYVAFYFLQWTLAPGGFLRGDRGTPISNPVQADAAFPRLFGQRYTVTWAFVLSLLAVVFCWWLLNRSSMGFAFRAIGENSRAAKVAGINVQRTTVAAMMVAGLLIGLAGVQQVLGPLASQGFGDGVDAGIGFDAITVALLGSSQPVGVMLAGLLFGAFNEGGRAMQAGAGINISVVSVIQSLIVLFIAAPPLVRAIFRLPQPSQVAAARKAEAKQVAAAAKREAKNAGTQAQEATR